MSDEVKVTERCPVCDGNMPCHPAWSNIFGYDQPLEDDAQRCLRAEIVQHETTIREQAAEIDRLRGIRRNIGLTKEHTELLESFWRTGEVPALEDMAGAVSEALDLIERLRSALASVNRILSPGNRTFDEFIRDMDYACDIARAALNQKEKLL